MTEQAPVPPDEADGEDEAERDGDTETDADGEAEALRDGETETVGDGTRWATGSAHHRPAGSGTAAGCSASGWFTVTQSSATMPPVSPESGFHDQ